MKQFNLKEYLDNPSRKVVTRDGKAVKIHCTNYIGAHHIIAQVEGDDYSSSFTKDGRYANDREDSQLDLFFAPEKHEGWVNVFKGGSGNTCVGDSRIFKLEEDAKKGALTWKTYIGTAKIEWEE